MEPRGDQYSSAWTIVDRPQRIKIGEQRAVELRNVFLNRGERDREKEKKLVDSLYENIGKGRSLREATQNTLNAVQTISDIHLQNQKTTKDWSAQIMNDLFEGVFSRLALEYGEAVPQSFMNGLLEQEAILSQQKTPYERWYTPKIHGIANAFKETKNSNHWLHELKTRLRGQVEGLNIDDLRQEADEMWRMVQDERVYGIKDCFFNTQLFLSSKESFFVYDPEFGIEDPQIRKVFKQFEALFAIGPLPIRNKVKASYHDESQKLSKDLKLKFHHVEFQNATSLFFVDHDGKFVLNVSKTYDLEDVFKKAGMEIEFQYFRLFMYMRLSDLTRRIDPASPSPSLDEFEQDAAKKTVGFLGFGKNHKKPDYKRLVVPRMIKDSPVGKKEEEQLKRFVDKHKVVWHIRKLPQGYHATERAIKYAQEYNVTLTEGETIVREHWRGNIGNQEERPTKATFRQ